MHHVYGSFLPRHAGGMLFLLLACLLAVVAGEPSAEAKGVWTVKQADDWHRKHPWLVGCNFAPAYAINELEMWQADTFDLAAIDHELGLAESLGFNSVRVFLHNLLWEQDSKGFLERMDKFLGAADKHHIGVMFVLFDSCWDPFPKTGKQRDPRPGVHNSGWMQAPGQEILKDPARYDSLKPYVTGVLRHFRNDRRVQVWDVYNEPDNTNDSAYGKVELPDKKELTLALMTKAIGWAHEVRPSQPLTIGVWAGDWSDRAKLNPTQKFSLENSDVVSFHCYEKPDTLKKWIESLRQWNRPLLCTEYMARPQGSQFDSCLEVMKEAGVGAYNWGFVSGKTQTIYPWDSWQKTYTEEPPVWFHDIFRPDGSPYRPEEVAYIRRVTGKK